MILPYFIYVILAYLRTIPALVGVVRWRNMSGGLRYICFWLWMGVFQTSAKLYAALTAGHNLSLKHYYAPIELILLSAFFYHSGFRHKSFLIPLVLIFLFSSIGYGYFIGDPAAYNSMFRLIESVCISVMAISTLFNMSHGQHGVIKSGKFWISGGLLIFFATNIMSMGFENIALQGNITILLLFNQTQEFTNVLSILFVTVGLWKHTSYTYT